MIILDTNVVSEPLNKHGSPEVLAWLDRQPSEALYLAATVLSELIFGIEILPGGKRKTALAMAMRDLLAKIFEDRFLAFGREAAETYAILASRSRSKGQPISVPDCQIAAIAAVHGFTVATRDTAPFLAAGVAVVNPWSD
jgi:toxin FitB